MRLLGSSGHDVTKRDHRILFTAFEPSGDDLGGAVIRVLRRRRPDIDIHAWGGASMEAAGAKIVERTGENAVMGLPGLGTIVSHVRQNGRIARWMDAHKPTLHIAVDSPAANFPICKAAKRRGVPVAHLAAPQLWAWAPWRIRKLRRLTNHVMCLLPFEEEWFRSRNVPATFIGHPLFDRPLPTTPGLHDEQSVAGGSAPNSLRLAVMPGSRQKELSRHLPMLLTIIKSLRTTWPDLQVRFAVQDETANRRVRDLCARLGGLPDGASIVVGDDSVAMTAAWADVALTKSGTVTLHITRQRCPMVVVYRTMTIGYLLIVRWLMTTEFRSMPNLIAGRRVVEEFVPHCGGPAPIERAVRDLLESEEKRDAMRGELDRIAKQFESHSALDAAAKVILSLIDEDEPVQTSPLMAAAHSTT